MKILWVMTLVFLSKQLALAADPIVPLRIAMVDFTSDDGSYRSSVAAAKMTALIQAELFNEPDIEWVERDQMKKAADELNLNVSGFTSGASTLRLGKWVKADLLVLGRFNQNEEGTRTLVMEVVEVDRADVLATRSLPVELNRVDPVTLDPALAKAASLELKNAFKEVHLHLAGNKNKKVMAPLFFQNVDPSPRLNSLETDLLESFQKMVGATGDLRVIRTPRAFESLGEADLVALGLAEVDQDAWQKMADAYVWGAYHELKAAGLPFEKVPVGVTLFVWNGNGEPRQFMDQATVSELPSLVQRLTRKILDDIQKTQLKAPSPTARSDVSRWLMARGEVMKKTMDSFGNKRDAFLASDEGKALSRDYLKTLQMACFFDPTNRKAHWEILSTPHFPENMSIVLQKWQQLDELEDFTLKFGGGTVSYADRQLYLDQIQLVMDILFDLKKRIELPEDISDEGVADWHNVMEARFIQKVKAYDQLARKLDFTHADEIALSYGDWINVALYRFKNPGKAAELVELLWPKFKPYYFNCLKRGETRWPMIKDLEPGFNFLYSALGKPERVDELLKGAVKLPKSPDDQAQSPLPPPDQALSTHTVVSVETPEKEVFESLARGNPSTRILPMPQTPQSKKDPNFEPFYYCTKALCFADHKLWISVQCSLENIIGQETKWSLLLFRYDPATGVLQNLSEKIGKHSQITSILEHEGSVWLTLDFDGVWRLNPSTLEVQKFGEKEGVLTPHMYSSASAEKKLVFGGVREGKGLLNLLDTTSMSWVKLECGMENPASSSGDPGNMDSREAIKDLSVFKQWVVVGRSSWVLHDISTGKNLDLKTVLGLKAHLDSEAAKRAAMETPLMWGPLGSSNKHPQIFSTTTIQSCSSDESGYWFVLSEGLCLFDPVSGQKENWKFPLGSISASAQDGDFLWVVHSFPDLSPIEKDNVYYDKRRRFLEKQKQAKSHILIFHKPTKKWVGLVEINGVVNSICVSEKNVFLGLQYSDDPILQLDKQSVLAIPNEKWVPIGKEGH